MGNMITLVETSKGWAVRQVGEDGSELYIVADIFEPKFSKEHAQMTADNLRHHLECGGKTYAKPLPAGVSLLG